MSIRSSVVTTGLVLTAALALGCEREPEVRAPAAPTAADATGDATADAKTAGERVGDVGELMPDSIYEVLAEATEAAVQPGNFGDLVERFAANDRGRFAGLAAAAIDTAARPFDTAWNKNFNASFDIDDPKAVFRSITRIEPAGKTNDVVRARVIFPAASGVPQFALDMVKDVTWHIDVLDTYDRESLRTALATQLEMLQKSDAEWSTAKLQAQQVVARRVLAAIANTDMVGASQRETPPGPGQ